MTKENKNSESAQQREDRLEQLIGQNVHLCPNDLRFLLLQRASRLNDEDLRIALQRIRLLAAQETQNRARQGQRDP